MGILAPDGCPKLHDVVLALIGMLAVVAIIMSFTLYVNVHDLFWVDSQGGHRLLQLCCDADKTVRHALDPCPQQ